MHTKLLVLLLFFVLNTFVSSCSDLTVNGGQPWYDSAGEQYTCNWYGEMNTRCSTDGYQFENFGMVANEACCVCGGGFRSPTTSPSPTPGPTYSWQRPFNYDDDEDNDDDTTTIVVTAIGAFVAACMTFGMCVKLNHDATRSTNLRTRPTPSAPQQTQHAASSIVDERDIRRQFILANIIHKVSSYDYCMHLNISHIIFTLFS